MQHVKRHTIALLLMTGFILLLLSSCSKTQSAATTPTTDSPSAQAPQVNAASGFDWRSAGDITAVAAGNGYSFLLNSDKKLYAWGGSRDYVLGLDFIVPAPEMIMDDIIVMSAGSSHAAAITSNHTLFLWGNNTYHQLGAASAEKSAAPVQVMTNIQDVVCADGFTVVLDTEGAVWTFGRNQAGQLGIGTTEDKSEPTAVLKNVVRIAAGDAFVIALQNDGTVWGWGACTDGQLLGSSDGSVENAGQMLLIQSTPVKLMDNIKNIACGAAHVLALDNEGKLYTWGLNSSGQLGNNGVGTWADVNFGGKKLFSPEASLIMTDVAQIAGGGWNSAAIKTDGTLWLWGSNTNFQIGDGTSAAAPVPVEVMDDVKSVSVSQTHVMAVTNDNRYFAWGSNKNNILGDGNNSVIYEPVKILDNIKSASLYSDHAFAVTNDGVLYAFGDNSMGQLGTGDFINTSVPTPVMHDVLKAAAGMQHSLCLKTDGSVWTWGSNTFGQLGNAQEEDVYSAFGVWDGGHPVWSDASGKEVDTVGPTAYKPAQVFENAADIYTSWHTSYAITKEGALYGWGWNELYQLGNDTRSSTASPLLIMEQVKTLIPSYALINNSNTLWTWGSNPKDPYQILPIEALSGVQSAAVLDRQFLAVKDDGTLWIWGQSVSGELTGTEDYFNTIEDPVQIGTGIKKVAAAYGNIFVMDTDDTLWALDSNDIYAKKASPKSYEVFTHADAHTVMEDVRDVSIGLESVLVLKNDGTLWGFGSNESGQLAGSLRYFTPQHINK